MCGRHYFALPVSFRNGKFDILCLDINEIAMTKDKILHIRTDKVFLDKLEYLKRINGFKSLSDTIRKIIEKEYRKENPDSV